MEQTFIEIYDILLFRAEYIVGNKDDARDIVQEMYLAVKSRPAGTVVGNKRGYLYGMVTKLSMRWLRDRKLYAQIESDAMPADPHGDAGFSAEIDALLTVLTDMQKTIVRLHDIEGYTCLEIALRTKRTPTAVKKQLAIAHKKLKECTKK